MKKTLINIISLTKDLLDKQAKLGADMDKMAKQYWTTAENYKAFSTSLETLGIKYQDLFWTTQEELDRFKELYALGKSLEVPEAINETLRDVRDIRQEFNKLKVVSTYFFKAVAYYIGQYSGKEIKSFRDTIRSIVNAITKRMPEAARFLGKALGVVVNTVSAISKLAKTIYNVVKPVFGWIKEAPTWIKLIGIALLAWLKGPLGLIIAGISFLMLLIDDYMGWKNGKKSWLDWSMFDAGLEKAKGFIDDLKVKVDVLKDSFKELFDFLSQVFDFPSLSELRKELQLAKENVQWWLDKLGWKKDPSPDDSQSDWWRKLSGGYKGTQSYTNPGTSANEAAVRASGIRGTAGGNVNNVTLNADSHDTINVNSVDEAISLQKKNRQNYIDALNSGMSPIFGG